MLNPYYVNSHISAKKFRRLVELFIDGEKIAHTAKKLNLEQRTVRGIYRKIRKRLEEDCWQRIHAFHPKILNPSFPFQVVHPAVRYKNFQMQNDVSRYAAAVVALYFEDDTVATSILMVDRLRLNSGKFPVDQPDDLDDTALEQESVSCCFADLRFVSKGYLIYDDEADYLKDYMQEFWLFARLQTFQSDRRNSDKFYLHLKEIEWRFNNLTYEERVDMTIHLEELAFDKKLERLKKSEVPKIEDPEITAINTKLHLTLLELLKRNPLNQLSSVSENILHT